MQLIRRAGRAIRHWLHGHILVSQLLIVALVATPGYWRIEQVVHHDEIRRCEQGNEFRDAAKKTLHKVDDYINALLAGFGTGDRAPTRQLTAEERAQYATAIVKIFQARQEFLASIDDPAFDARDCAGNGKPPSRTTTSTAPTTTTTASASSAPPG